MLASFLTILPQANAQTDSNTAYINDMDYVLGDVKQVFIRNQITTKAQSDNLIKGFKAMRVNGIRVPIFATGQVPNKAMFDYFFDQALAAGFKIFANPAQGSGGQRIACEVLNVSGSLCTTRNNNTRTNILINRIKEFSAEYPCDWINPFNEDGAPGAAWSANQMNTIYASLRGQMNGADLIGPGVWGLPASINVLNNTNVANYIDIATTHNLGFHHGSWSTFINAASSRGLSVWDSEVNHNLSKSNSDGIATRLEAAMDAGVDGLVLYDSWNYINRSTGAINSAGQGVMDLYLKFRTDRKYYIENIGVRQRLAADGQSETPYGAPITATGPDVEWVFVDKGNGYYHIRRAAGGSKPGLRTDGTEFADMQTTSSNGIQTYYDFSSGSADGSYHITLPDWPFGEGRTRVQMTPTNDVKFVTPNNRGSWVSYRFIEAGDFEPNSNTNTNTSQLVQIRKRNALDFALDGMGGAANGQNIHLWTANSNNANQQWIEIDRGNGFFSYQKQGTNHCMDGGNGGATRQNVHLWVCNSDNQNQHWQKVNVDSGFVQLRKRNSTGFTLNGGSGGSTGQNVSMWNSSSSSQNLHWRIDRL